MSHPNDHRNGQPWSNAFKSIVFGYRQMNRINENRFGFLSLNRSFVARDFSS